MSQSKGSVKATAQVHAEIVGAAIAAERERCAKSAEYLAKGQALEIGGKTLLLGSMTTGECAAQEATATAIAAAIRNKETAR